ncbi:MAG: CapA family protein [Candidatus Saccharibacteria bacterium]|nr:CapA family protein [Candidatus Saccharibacteria bacterium]
MERKRSQVKLFLISVVLFVGVFSVAFVGIQFITKTGIFKIPGVVRYEESDFTPEQLALIQGIFTDEITLDKDVTISTRNTSEYPDLAKGEYIYSIAVPVTDFYDTRSDRNEFEETEMIPIEELDFSKKLLAIDGEYYLDTFDKGAYYQVITFDSEKFDEEIKPLVDATFNKTWPSQDKVLTMAQTGVTALSRGMNGKLNEVGDAKFFSAEIADFLRGFDITHTSNEASFSSQATKENICSDPRFIDLLVDIGLDVVELTGNHNQDCGDEAAKNTVDIYAENNIKVVGGGKTAEEAAKPLELSEKENNITFLAYNLSTGGATLDDTPGANQYIEERAATEITAAKERGDFVIVDIQYFECSAYVSETEDPTCDAADSAAGDQVGFFRHLIDMGANVVVGTSAHQPQTFELYEDGVIYYGLGNLFFDQAWWPGTTRSLVLAHYFYDGKLLQTRIIPTVYDKNFQTRVMEDPEWFLQRLINVRP